MPRVDEWGVVRSSVPKRIYDGVALLLLMWPATAGMWLLGSTRAWGYAPGLAISFLGSLLACARSWFSGTRRADPPHPVFGSSRV